jgi:nucleotidyltransferase substrate binding protein (TIGR01987 family)
MRESVLDLSPLRKAIASLEGGLKTVNNSPWFNRQSEEVRYTLLAGVIQNFEFVYEISVKMLKRRIEPDALTPTEADLGNYRSLLRIGAEKGLIKDVEAWFEYRGMRNNIVHTYDQAKAEQVYQGISPFLEDAKDLLTRLEDRNG